MKKVVIGSLFLYCTIEKGAGKGLDYVIANNSLISEDVLLSKLNRNKVDYRSPFMNEA